MQFIINDCSPPLFLGLPLVSGVSFVRTRGAMKLSSKFGSIFRSAQLWVDQVDVCAVPGRRLSSLVSVPFSLPPIFACSVLLCSLVRGLEKEAGPVSASLRQLSSFVEVVLAGEVSRYVHLFCKAQVAGSIS